MDSLIYLQHVVKVKDISKRRIRMLKDAENDPKMQLMFKRLCATNPRFFANYFAIGEDPRLEYSRFPLILFPKQEEFLDWVWSLEQKSKKNKKKASIGACVKSRDTGASVMASLYFANRFIFGKNFSGAIGSRKAELVYNDGNPDAIFSKVELVLKNLPDWMRPAYYKKRNLLYNTETGSNIKGEAGDNIGRGGRSTVYMIDEAAFLERSSAVIAAVSKNTDCLILFSTPNGRDNQFAKMYHNDAISTFMIHWSDDPRRGEEWYQDQCEIFDSHIIAQELDCDFDADREGVLITAKMGNAAIDAFDKLGLKREKSKQAQVVAGFDPAGIGRDRSFLTIRCGESIIFMDSWKHLDTGESAYRVIGICKSYGVNKLVVDAGYGATILSILRKEKQDIPFDVVPINFGGSPSSYYWRSEERTSKDKFINARAEMFWLLKERFRKTYEMVHKIREWEAEELIDIRTPEIKEILLDRKNARLGEVAYKRENLDILISQITVITWAFTDSGKIKMISKKDLESSPDGLDSVALTYYDVGKAKKPNWRSY